MSLCCDQDFLQNQQVWLYKPMHCHAECSDGYGRLNDKELLHLFQPTQG